MSLILTDCFQNKNDPCPKFRDTIIFEEALYLEQHGEIGSPMVQILDASCFYDLKAGMFFASHQVIWRYIFVLSCFCETVWYTFHKVFSCAMHYIQVFNYITSLLEHLPLASFVETLNVQIHCYLFFLSNIGIESYLYLTEARSNSDEHTHKEMLIFGVPRQQISNKCLRYVS